MTLWLLGLELSRLDIVKNTCTIIILLRVSDNYLLNQNLILQPPVTRSVCKY